MFKESLIRLNELKFFFFEYCKFVVEDCLWMLYIVFFICVVLNIIRNKIKICLWGENVLIIDNKKGDFENKLNVFF